MLVVPGPCQTMFVELVLHAATGLNLHLQILVGVAYLHMGHVHHTKHIGESNDLRARLERLERLFQRLGHPVRRMVRVPELGHDEQVGARNHALVEDLKGKRYRAGVWWEACMTCWACKQLKAWRNDTGMTIMTTTGQNYSAGVANLMPRRRLAGMAERRRQVRP